MAQRRRGYYDFNYYKPTKAKEVKGGIKAHTKRGAFGKNWWAKQWISVLESFNIGARFTRGRTYARKGQVVSIDILPGKVQAKVQGSRSSPYKVEIRIKVLAKKEIKKLADILSKKAAFAAKLLAGEMPQDIETAFNDAGLSLFPSRLRDLKTDCSCPDWSNPCKHIAAAYYLLGEEFDRDPFLIFKLRGIKREEFLGLLGDIVDTAVLEEAEEELPPEPLAMDPIDFWRSNSDSAAIQFRNVNIPPISAAIPKRLGNFPFWRGKDKFIEKLEQVYKQASEVGLRVFVGDGIGENGE